MGREMRCRGSDGGRGCRAHSCPMAPNLPVARCGAAPRPGSLPHHPEQERNHSAWPSSTGQEVLIRLLNKAVGKSLFCIKTKWRFSTSVITSAPSSSAAAESWLCFGSSFLCLIPERNELRKGKTEAFALKMVLKNSAFPKRSISTCHGVWGHGWECDGVGWGLCGQAGLRDISRVPSPPCSPAPSWCPRGPGWVAVSIPQPRSGSVAPPRGVLPGHLPVPSASLAAWEEQGLMDTTQSPSALPARQHAPTLAFKS